MRNKHIFHILLFLSLSPAWCCAQYLRINHIDSRTDLSFDLNHLYNYNVYEQNRWGGGLFLQTPLRYDKRYGSDFQNYLQSSIYLAWASGDHALKYGGNFALGFPRYVARKVFLGYAHDLEHIGSHSFSKYNILNTIENSSYFSSRFNAYDRIWAGMDIDILGPGFLTITLRHSLERPLFKASGLLYPKINDEDALPRSAFDEAVVQLKWGDNWIFELIGGMVHHGNHGGDKSFARVMAQYSKTFTLNGKFGKIKLFAQCGSTLDNSTPISRRFSLDGTGGSLYYFSNSLLTVHPNTFMADCFTHIAMRYTLGVPLWHNALSSPTPFVQCNFLWGAMNGYNGLGENGVYELLNGYAFDYSLANPNPGIELISLEAPYYGLLEPAIGIDQLAHWGILDFGVAVAWQMAPKKSLYYSDNFFDKFSVMCIAKLVIDK